jgi:uncharacterized membrane protein YhaH (DUF805 family)
MLLDLFILDDSHSFLLTMLIAFKMWLSIIDLLIFTLLGVFIMVYSIVALRLLDTKTAGILTLIVYISFFYCINLY